MPLLLFAVTILPRVSEARPEYAAREKLSCIQCHVTPWGGGPRTVLGKVYGSHLYPPGKFSNQDLVSFSLRTIGYYPTNISLQNSTQGVGTMEAAVTGNAAVIDAKKDENGELRAVATYNVSPVASSGAQLREGYARYGVDLDDPDKDWELIVGHFYVPFGLLTDEHRTYTRIQTDMTINNYDTGVALSHDLPHQFHVDIAAVNEFQTGGDFNTGDITVGTVANVRWNPASLPFLLGASANYQHMDFTPSPYGSSVYAVVSVDRITHDAVSGSLEFERVDAKNWNNPIVNTGGINPSLSQFFIPASDSSYQTAVNGTHSVGYYALAKYWPMPKLNFVYKLDYLKLDSACPSDAFWRHGFGLEYFLNSNMNIDLRGEIISVGRKEISGSNVLAAQTDVFALLRLWL